MRILFLCLISCSSLLFTSEKEEVQELKNETDGRSSRASSSENIIICEPKKGTTVRTCPSSIWPLLCGNYTVTADELLLLTRVGENRICEYAVGRFHSKEIAGVFLAEFARDFNIDPGSISCVARQVSRRFRIKSNK